jgi:hypothetical protein
MPNAVVLSQSRGAGWVYVTPDGLPNPWDTLPSGSYWTNELAYVQLTGCSPVVKARVLMKKLATPPGDDTLVFSGEATLGAPALDPVVDGLHVVIDENGSTVLDVTLGAGAYADPPGAGWRASGSGTKWTYTNRTAAPPGGITKATLKTSASPGFLKFTLKGKDGSYAITSANPPLTAQVDFEPAIVDGPCAIASFTGPDATCETDAAGSVVKCR